MLGGTLAQRTKDIARFYAALDALRDSCGDARTLAACHGRMAWPLRGVYFFTEPGEDRTDSGGGPRVARVGTHALRSSSRASLWRRLAQHKGHTTSGEGNHRGSVFRLLVGSTLLKTAAKQCDTWGIGSSAPVTVRHDELPIELEVSRIIGAMPFQWLAVDDAPGPHSLRGYVERNSIALLSNFGKRPLDAPSPNWRGRDCHRGEGRVCDSGLWNQNHVDEDYDPAFLDVLDNLVNRMPESS